MKAMRRAYRSGVELSKLQYLECHATATQLGDATELETLGQVLHPEFPDGKRIPITSVKANIGHSLEAAGMAGLVMEAFKELLVKMFLMQLCFPLNLQAMPQLKVFPLILCLVQKNILNMLGNSTMFLFAC